MIIGSNYTSRDSRVSDRSNNIFAGVKESHKIAFRLIPPAEKYFKVFSDFDFIFADCIKGMVEVAEKNPSVDFVGSYQLSGSIARWEGFKDSKDGLPGREICHQILLGGGLTFGFGTPTSILYGDDFVRKGKELYANSLADSGTSAYFKHLQNYEIGFVISSSFARANPDGKGGF